MFRDIGPMELLLVLLVVLIVFGAAKLPSVGRDLGKAIREFRKASTEPLEDEKKTDAMAAAATPAPTEKKEETK